MRTIGAIIMQKAFGSTAQEELVGKLQQAATRDLILLLKAHSISPIILCSPQFDWLPKEINVWLSPDPAGRPFHFGQYLAEAITGNRLETVLYFGGASAPLLNHELVEMLIGIISNAGESASSIPAHVVLTNNIHSSDWVAISQVQDALGIIRGINRDNSLAWLLQESGKYQARILTRVRPAASLDLDTPADLAIVRYHADCPPHLSLAIEEQPLLQRIPVQEVLNVLARSESHVTLMGRVAPRAWEALNKQTRAWIRVYAEERGMVASERDVRGEVRSLLGYLLEEKGHAGFFKALCEVAEAAIIDSRVLMAHHGVRFSDADRFASDLFMVDAIQNEWLRDFTAAAYEAPIPIILGGHSVVAGGLYVLSEILAGGMALH